MNRSRTRQFRIRSGFVPGACLLAVVAMGAMPRDARAAGGSGCEGLETDAVVARVQARYDSVSDIEADFEQTTRSVMLGGSGLGDEVPTKGHVQIAKPGRMRWHYLSPRESLVLSDGQTLWIHDVEAGEVARARVTEGYLAGAALQFLLGDGALVDEFEVAPDGCEGELVRLALTPKVPASYEKLGLVVDGKSGVVLGSTIHDLFGNVTELRFESVQFDRKPSAETFVWQPAKGIRVIDLEPAGTGKH